MKSQFKGVSRDVRTNRWKAQLFIAGKNRSLGYFDTEEQAGRMWDTARVRLGEFFESPIPKLNLGYEQLHDPHEILWLRERLEAEGATKYAPVLLTQGTSAPVAQTRNKTPDDSEPVEICRARLFAEAGELNRRLTEILAELNKTFLKERRHDRPIPNTSSRTGSL